MLLGLTPPDRGCVELFGRSAREAVEEGLVAAMLQAGALIRDVTVRELVELVASLYPDPLGVDEAMDLAGVRAIADHRTNGLSGGQAQRARLALAVVADPALLVLDEPTVGLDVQSRRSFWDSMRAFAARDRTVVFATHYLEEADAYADRVVLMAAGRIVAEGSTTEIRSQVGGRTIRATLDSIEDESLARLPGVAEVDRRGDVVVLTCADSDAAIRALLDAHPRARDIEIESAGLEDAFIELTAAEGSFADSASAVEARG
jgi:ABC-2 type transport system ATP-binding protein